MIKEMNFKSCLYLIPNLIGATDVDDVLPKNLYSQISHIRHFIVEDIRNARRFLRSLSKDFVIDDLTFYELNKHTEIEQIEDYLKVSEQGLDIGLLSEAGLPCVADPGNLIVQLAHKKYKSKTTFWSFFNFYGINGFGNEWSEFCF